jgi:hypothetical protein
MEQFPSQSVKDCRLLACTVNQIYCFFYRAASRFVPNDSGKKDCCGMGKRQVTVAALFLRHDLGKKNGV